MKIFSAIVLSAAMSASAYAQSVFDGKAFFPWANSQGRFEPIQPLGPSALPGPVPFAVPAGSGLFFSFMDIPNADPLVSLEQIYRFAVWQNQRNALINPNMYFPRFSTDFLDPIIEVLETEVEAIEDPNSRFAVMLQSRLAFFQSIYDTIPASPH